MDGDKAEEVILFICTLLLSWLKVLFSSTQRLTQHGHSMVYEHSPAVLVIWAVADWP